MKRFHVHLNVVDLAASLRFYSHLFGAEPSVLKHDYAKWMIEDPRVNFAISTRGGTPGIDHLGIQVQAADDLSELGQRLAAAGSSVVPEAATVCCYARSDKLWIEDPQGTRWETFHTHGEATTYYASDSACATDGAACTPDVREMKPMVETGGPCCPPQSGCC
jgi:predicted enzyme related to lactoylglutathione lyase